MRGREREGVGVKRGLLRLSECDRAELNVIEGRGESRDGVEGGRSLIRMRRWSKEKVGPIRGAFVVVHCGLLAWAVADEVVDDVDESVETFIGGLAELGDLIDGFGQAVEAVR